MAKAKKITTAKEALEAVQQDGMELETILGQVKKDPSSLKGVPAQSFDICAAALLEAVKENREDEVLYYVDPEFRTASLLKTAGIDSKDFGDEPVQYRNKWDPGDVSGAIVLYGKCSSPNLEAVPKMLRRCLEMYAGDWKEVWLGTKPFLADFYEVKLVPDKNYFAMEFRFTEGVDDALLERFRGVIFNYFWDEFDYFPASVIEELELFYQFSYEDSDFCGCGYCIEKLEDEDFDNLVIEKEDWNFRLDEEESRDLCEKKNEFINKRIGFWVSEDSGKVDRLAEIIGNVPENLRAQIKAAFDNSTTANTTEVNTMNKKNR